MACTDLVNRNFLVSVGEFTSVRMSVNCGVPQGSIMGPLLFNLYICFLLAKSFKNTKYLMILNYIPPSLSPDNVKPVETLTLENVAKAAGLGFSS